MQKLHTVDKPKLITPNGLPTPAKDPVFDILTKAIDLKLASAIVLGRAKDGTLAVMTSGMTLADLNWTLDEVKAAILRGEAK